MRLFFYSFFWMGFTMIGVSTKAQTNIVKPVNTDTTRETIIYEYDTLYAAPDTIRLTDTVYRYQIQQNKTSKAKSLNLFNKINIFNTLSDKWTAGIGVYSYFSGFLTHNIDSFAVKRTLNFEFELHVNYQSLLFRYTLGLGFLPMHQQLQYQGSTYLNSQVVSNGIRDSLLLKSNCITNNYYNYLQLFFNVGKKWGKQKFFFVLDASLKGSFLMNYHALLPIIQPTKINSSSVEKYGLKIGLSPSFGYKFRDGLSVSLVPFCSYSPFATKKYTESELLVFGVGLRLQ